jgi:glycosyltransferase involved in cell wall biosynthesis
MNMLWLAHAIPYPPKAGFLLRSYNLLRELARHQSVDLIAFVQEQWVTTLFDDFAAGIAESKQALGEFCASVTFLPIDNLQRPAGKRLTALLALASGSSYSASWLDSTAARAAIADKISSASYDLVHFDTIGLVAYRDLVRNVPATLMHHNIESHMMQRRAENSTNGLARMYFRHEGRLLRQLEQRTAAQFSRHITCSDLDSERLRELVPDIDAIAIPNGVDCEFFHSAGLATRPNSLIFVGTMNWYPNVDAMLFFLREIWPLLQQRVPDVTLDIAGSNPPDSVLQLAQSLRNVKVHGYVPDVRPMIDSAALFVCPIRDGGGTKLKILDAFAMKKCVVAHPIACEGINVTNQRDVVFASEPEEYVQRIAELLGDDARRARIGAAARELVEREYSFRAIGAEFSRMMAAAARPAGAHAAH